MKMVLKKKSKKIISKKKSGKTAPKKFVWESKPIKEKPKKSDFVSQPLHWKIPWIGKLLRPKKVEKPKKSDFVRKENHTKFKWERRKIIQKPRASDFETKQKRIKWKIPWLEELINPKNRFDDPKSEDFEDKKQKKIAVGNETVLPARSLLGKETKIVIEKETITEKSRTINEKPTSSRDWIASAILLLVAADYVVFLGMLIGRYLMNVNTSDYASLNGLFYAITIVSILLSLFFCLKKNITTGFVYISIILIVYLGLSMLLAKDLFETIGILLILAAILPIEIYNIFYNIER